MVRREASWQLARLEYGAKTDLMDWDADTWSQGDSSLMLKAGYVNPDDYMLTCARLRLSGREDRRSQSDGEMILTAQRGEDQHCALNPWLSG